MIHYLSPNAKGELRGTTRRAGTVIEKEGEKDIERTMVEHIPLRIACSFKGRSEQATFYKPLITCPHCLAFIAEEEAAEKAQLESETLAATTPPEVQDLDSKLSAEEQQALKDAHTKLDPSVLTI